jgi:hypothetical protein
VGKIEGGRMIDLNRYSEQFKAIAAKPVPECHCFECNIAGSIETGEGPLRFDCEGCKRDIPWCYGAADELSDGTSLFEYCDDCANVIIDDREDDSWKQDALAIAKVFGVSTRR